MPLDSEELRAGGHDALEPMQIAHNTLFTAREKIDLLHKLKAEVTGALENDLDVGMTPGEVDAAIEEVRLEVQDGQGSETVLSGDK